MAQFFQYGEPEMAYLSDRSPQLGQAIAQMGKLERPVTPDLFEALVDSMVGQQISAKAHRTVMGRIQAHFGQVTPQAVHAMPDEQLQAFGLSFRKVTYIKAAAGAVLDGGLNMEALRAMTDEQVKQTLTALPGIGVWTAEMLMLFSLERPDILSYGDLGIRRGLCSLYRHREITPRLYQKYRRLFTPHGSVASLYLWAIASGGGL